MSLLLKAIKLGPLCREILSRGITEEEHDEHEVHPLNLDSAPLENWIPITLTRQGP